MDIAANTSEESSIAWYGNSSEAGPKPLPLYTRLIFITIYTTISFVAFFGNVIVCYIVLAYQRKRAVTYYFILNLACSDILVSILCIPFTVYANLLVEYWPFGSIMCPIVNYFQAVTVFLNAFTLVAISFDRFRVIICPFNRRLSTKQAMLVIAFIWILSLIVTLPIPRYSRVTPGLNVYNEIRDFCKEVWPGGTSQRTMYSILIMVLQYFLPLFVLAFTYSWIGVVIWVKRTPGEANDHRDQRIAASKRKMVKMMITVVIIYGLCWLPLHSITLIGDLHESIWEYKHIQPVWITCHLLAMSNCCYNPMVYCWMNTSFRDGFKYVFRHLPCVGEPTGGNRVYSPPRSEYTCVYSAKHVRMVDHTNRNKFHMTRKCLVDNNSQQSSSST